MTRTPERLMEEGSGAPLAVANPWSGGSDDRRPLTDGWPSGRTVVATRRRRPIGTRARALSEAVSYGLRRAVGAAFVPLASASSRSRTLCGASEIRAVNPFIWDDHLPRIRGGFVYSAEETIERFLRRRSFQFRPVVAHWLRHAVLLDGSVYARGFRQELRPWGQNRRLRLGFRLAGPCAEVATGALAATYMGSTWWGHWLEDEVPLQLLAEQFAPPVAHVRPAYAHEAGYREALSLPAPARFGVAHFEELVILEDQGQNPLKAARYHAVRRRLAALPNGGARIFLSRGRSGARRVLVNEAEVRARLEACGFQTVDVATAGAEEILAACRGAEVVVGVEGSHLAPLLYLMREFGTMVILNPPFQVQTTVATVALFCRLMPGMFVCQPHAESRTDFTADPDELMRFIDEAIAMSAAQRQHLDGFVNGVLHLAHA